MKIIFCGPPHSGKSVFIANIIKQMPTDAYSIIRACPDGEGTWSNNRNQKETSIVRKKGKFTKTFIDDVCRVIDKQTNEIVLIDVGGVVSKENEKIFRHCDCFIVLSSDEEKRQEWLDFGQKLGLKCIACIDSSLEGKEEIYSRVPFIRGRIVGLKRGELLEESKVVKAVSSDIVKRSQYVERKKENKKDLVKTTIDDTEFGFEIGYGKEILTEDGLPVKKVKWSEDAIPKIYKYIKEKVNPIAPLRIYGVRANFVLCAICKVAKQNGIKDIKSYDMRTALYIPIKEIPKKKGIRKAAGLSYNIIESKESIFMDIDITKEQYSMEDYEKCILPKISEKKNLYISGRIPLWLLASISNSYNSARIFTFQPGKGFTCVSSIDEKDLGTVVEGVDGIDINQYFEDKKNKNKTNLPMKVEKKGLISTIKGWIRIVKEKNNNSKYLNDKIKSNKDETDTKTSEAKSKQGNSTERNTSDIKENNSIQIKRNEQTHY